MRSDQQLVGKALDDFQARARSAAVYDDYLNPRVALISDNYGVESTPARPCMDDYCATLPLHAHCLFKLGVYLGEIWHLSELADWLRKAKRSRFLLTAPPLRLPGAVGSPATPVATV